MTDHPTTPIRETVERVQVLHKRLAQPFEEADDTRVLAFTQQAASRVAEDLEALCEAVTALQAENARLREDAAALMPLARLGECAVSIARGGNDFDGGDVQEEAEKLGIVSQVPAEKPSCGEQCLCAEYDADICWRNTPATDRAYDILDAARTPTDGAG